MVGTFKMTTQFGTVEQLTSSRMICGGNFVSGENSGIWALGYARTTVDAGLGVNIKSRPLLCRLTGVDAFHRTDIDTTVIAQAETGNYVGHIFLLY
jgi:hypothetical protein